MRHKIINSALFCCLLPALMLQASSTNRVIGHVKTVQAKTKLPKINSYLVYYGSLNDQSLIDKVRANFTLMIAAQEITKVQVAKLKADDGKPKPLVFCYISIGEDAINAKQNGSPYPGDCPGKGQGPCYPPGTTPKYKMQDKVASYYVDEYKEVVEKNPKTGKDEKVLVPGHDYKPDRNIDDSTSGSLFVNTEDPVWRDTVKGEAKKLIDEVGCDGLFLDTLDMGWRDVYKWTRNSMRSLIVELNQITPNIIVNRGLFFVHEGIYQPQEIKEYKKHIWGLMFENFYTEKVGDKGIPNEKKDQDENDNYIKRLKDVQVFALDFMNCAQSDFDTLSEAQRDKVRQLGWHNYISWELTKTVRYDYQCP